MEDRFSMASWGELWTLFFSNVSLLIWFPTFNSSLINWTLVIPSLCTGFEGASSHLFVHFDVLLFQVDTGLLV